LVAQNNSKNNADRAISILPQPRMNHGSSAFILALVQGQGTCQAPALPVRKMASFQENALYLPAHRTLR
jgi:hypothetical protein